MDIHKPKPWHGVREFLKEYLIIVVGVLTALVGEQLVEWVHNRHELAEARDALHSELGVNAASLQAMAAQDECADVRLRLLEAWSDGAVKINSAHFASMQNRPLLYTLPTTAWEVTMSAAIAARMPLRERLAYADVYDELANEKGHVLDERRAWDLLARYAGKTVLDPEDARTLKSDLGSVRIRDDDRRLNAPSIIDAIAKLGVKPDQPPTGLEPRRLCGPPA